MKRQNDWYTGINHYDNDSEKKVSVERRTVLSPFAVNFHEQVEMVYVLCGNARIRVNGCAYQAEAGSFFCMYSHHFYEVYAIEEKLDIVCVKFFIGLFMYMSWEKHPKNANAKLMYDTRPMVLLSQAHRAKVEALFQEILEEKEEAHFGSRNVITYKTLELHMYFCRYAFEEIGSRDDAKSKTQSETWSVIKKVILATSGNLTLKDLAAELHCSDRTLNQRIKQTCGFTFFQLRRSAQMLGACALLHFADLTMNYISDLSGFASVGAFYRAFEQYRGMPPRDYQRLCIEGAEPTPIGSTLAMQFLQYMHLNFMHDLTLEDMSAAFYTKSYSAQTIIQTAFDMSFHDLLGEIRTSYAAAFLKSGLCGAMDAAAMCGFDSYSTFQRTFALYMNQSPAEFCAT